MPNKQRKPAADHPWRRSPSNEVLRWSREQAGETQVNNYKRGGGHKPWNGGNEKEDG